MCVCQCGSLTSRTGPVPPKRQFCSKEKGRFRLFQAVLGCIQATHSPGFMPTNPEHLTVHSRRGQKAKRGLFLGWQPQLLRNLHAWEPLWLPQPHILAVQVCATFQKCDSYGA